MLFLLFIIYSFLGWCMEMVVCYIATKEWVNRGFLIGPICPIYGCGCLLIILLLDRYLKDPIVLFVMAMLLCSLLEYFTSYLMEKLFKARWWDYSHKKYNINGRVCLDNIFAFGILGLLMIYLVNPFVVKMLGYVSLNIINVTAIVIAIIFIIDNLISLKVISSFKSVAKSVHKDSTAEITKKVREILSDKGRLYRRLVSAFDFIASDKLIKDIKNKVKQGAEFAVETIEKSKKRNLAIKNEIISEYNERLSQLKYAIKMQKKEMKEKLKKIK
jgi:uncharacterized membrane protein